MDDSDSSVNPDNLTMFQPADPLGRLIERIKLIGVGRAGIAAVRYLLTDPRLDGLDFLCVGLDSDLPEGIDPSKALQLETARPEGHDSVRQQTRGETAALEARQTIAESFTDTYITIVITDLECAVSLGASAVFASTAKDLNVLSLAIGVSQADPKNAGEDKEAAAGSVAIVNAADSTFLFQNTESLQFRDEKIDWNREFPPLFETVRDTVVCVAELLVCPMVDLMDMRAMLSGKGLARIGMGLAEGEHRIFTAARQAVDDSYLESSDLKQARRIIAHISGGPNLSFREISTLAEYLNERIDTDVSDIVFGTAIEESLGDSLRVTIITADLDNRTIH